MANRKTEGKPFITNVRLLKMTGLYQALNPIVAGSDGPTTLWGCNVYKFAHVLAATLDGIFLIFCATGLVGWTDDFNQWLNCWMLLVGGFNTLLNVIRVSQKSHVLWKCMDIMRDDFLCYRHYRRDTMEYYKNKTLTYTNVYATLCLAILLNWLIYPAFNTGYTVTDSQGHAVTYRNSVINILLYPMDAGLYDKLFPVVYTAEAVILTQCVIAYALFDSLLVIFCWSIVAHLKTIASAYSSLGYEQTESKPATSVENFKTIISDHAKVISVMRELFETIRPIIVCQLGTSTCILICFTYAYVANYFNGMPIMSVVSVKHFSSTMYGVLRLYILTKFCGLVDDQVNSMNFSLYSCNWLDQDLSFRKLLLLTMAANSANMKTLTITPTKIVDLKIFASTIQTSYTIVSVLLKRNLSKHN